MGKGNNSELVDAIRGGQIFKHYLTMFKQVFWWVVGAGGSIFIACFVAVMMFKSNKVEFFAWFNWIQSWYLVEFIEKPHKNIYYFEDFGQGFSAKAHTIYTNEGVNYWADAFIQNLTIATFISTVFFVIFVVGLVRFFVGKGKSTIENELIRGGQLFEAKDMKAHLKKLSKRKEYKNDFKPGLVDIGGILIPKPFETHGFAIFGSPGSGKTQLYMKFCDAARKLGERAIVNDRSGTIVEKFYKEGDIILNPLDTRCAPWSLFNECHHKHDYDRVANILFPEQNGDPFWYEAPRLIFVSLAMKESKKKTPSVHRLAEFILTCTVDELVALCSNTLAQSLMDKDVIKQTNSLRSVIVTKLQAFLLFEDHKVQGFSIRDWVMCEEQKGWIFITSNKDQEASLKLLITSWLEIASSSILSLKPDHMRRIWLWFDELHTLNKVESLSSTLAELRKYGGCGVIGFQGAKQAVSIYGLEGLDALIDSCATHVFFRQNNEGSAKYASQQLGKADMYESTSNLSYGASDIRDGAQHGNQRHVRELVLPSEIQSLPDLNGFIRFGKGLPVSRFKLTYIERETVAEGFIEDTDKLHRLDAIVTDPTGARVSSSFDESPDRFNEPDNNKIIDDKVQDPLAGFDIPEGYSTDDKSANRQQFGELDRFGSEPLSFDFDDNH
ncbi:type IV secretion system DNA-binding domain-containing protein [Thalassotalea marina]|uniref:Type IV conjugative transfer system coupling protein TraD n=1 Tax=Thalassotalea marina TaxID=1673741 RepID=A0A919BSL7_9GAMM|nr:type IV secretion system DNA-binding domain-containing protein [Thalassotalea marina]GHG07149.1 type IV conjugative transfer system coupling protein TraD [Thalassotalea marina]